MQQFLAQIFSIRKKYNQAGDWHSATASETETFNLWASMLFFTRQLIVVVCLVWPWPWHKHTKWTSYHYFSLKT